MAGERICRRDNPSGDQSNSTALARQSVKLEPMVSCAVAQCAALPLDLVWAGTREALECRRWPETALRWHCMVPDDIQDGTVLP
eukprot:8912290-Pyramimonas_sp.AAC.1